MPSAQVRIRQLSTVPLRGHMQLAVKWVDPTIPQHFVISGSDGSDGTYRADVGTVIDVDGAQWTCVVVLEEPHPAPADPEWRWSYTWFTLNYEVEVPDGLVIAATASAQHPGSEPGEWLNKIVAEWTLTNQNPDTSLPPGEGEDPHFTVDPSTDAVVGIPAAQIAVGVTFVEL